MALASEFARPDITRAGDINWHQPHAPIPFRHKTLEMGKTLANRGQSNLLCSLPPELLIRIAEHATTSAHSNLSRTCQYLAFILQPELFQRSNARGAWHVLDYGPMAYGCSRWDSNAVIRRAIVYGVPPDVHSYFADGNTPLCVASFHGCLTAVGYLLKQGVDPNVAGAHELTPLGHALRGLLRSHPRQVASLRARLGLQKGAMPVSLRYVKTIIALLDAGADPHCKLPWDFTKRYPNSAIKINALSVVLTAYDDGQLRAFEAEAIIRKLVSLGVSPHAEARFFVVTILEWAVEMYCKGFCSLGLVKLLVEHGADINYFTPPNPTWSADTSTALGLAIRHRNVTLVGYFMTGSKPAYALRQSHVPISPLCWAIMVGNPETVLAVLKAGTSPNYSKNPFHGYRWEYQYCHTVLGQAVYRQGRTENKEKILEYLVRWNANPNERDSEGRRPLGEALSEEGWDPTHHRPYMVELLLKHGAGPNLPSNQENKGEQLPLEQAITNRWEHTSRQRQEIVKMLLDAGANPNARSPNMGTRTYLMVALKSCWGGYQGDGDLRIIAGLYRKEKRRCAKILGLRTRISLAKTAEVRQGTGFASKIVLMLLRKGATVSYWDLFDVDVHLVMRQRKLKRSSQTELGGGDRKRVCYPGMIQY
jgi:ankyrin repeat protein